jgi:phosphoribosylamine--glycine ligase
MPLGDAADGRIARHLRNQVNIHGDHGRAKADAGAGACGLATSVPSADYDNVETTAHCYHCSSERKSDPEKEQWMKVLIIGGGGREHAIAWKLKQSPRISRICVSPGNAGTALEGVNLTSTGGYLALAESIDAGLTVVGPEGPLVAGVVDEFRNKGRVIIGPTRAAARLEGSKVYSKDFMVRAGVPTAQAFSAETKEQAKQHIGDFGYPVVLKADGLAAGKGVIIAGSEQEALSALEQLPQGKVVVEEFLQGEEVSFIVYTDGNTVIPLEATQDHKAVHDGDVGPNTGGMGAYCDGRILTREQAGEVMRLVIHPTLDLMKQDGIPYTGFLYAGLMMTAAGPKVLEFNARLGDPETQALMHRMESDLMNVFLDNETPSWKADPSVCVVMAAHGYPGEVRTGDEITGIETCGTEVFQAGTRWNGPRLETSGGRVIGVTASGGSLEGAITNAYSAVRNIHFDGMHYRTDIGKKGLKRW